MNILVLDDDFNLGTCIGEFIGITDNKAVVFQEICKAMRYFSLNDIDMVMVDYNLIKEDFTGNDFISWVKNRKEIPCVLMTASETVDEISKLRQNWDVFVNKVVLAKDFLEVFNGIKRNIKVNSRKDLRVA